MLLMCYESICCFGVGKDFVLFMLLCSMIVLVALASGRTFLRPRRGGGRLRPGKQPPDDSNTKGSHNNAYSNSVKHRPVTINSMLEIILLLQLRLLLSCLLIVILMLPLQ